MAKKNKQQKVTPAPGLDGGEVLEATAEEFMKLYDPRVRDDWTGPTWEEVEKNPGYPAAAAFI